MRLFICIEFSDEVVKEVARIQEVLENQKFNGKMTELENLHLTLKFLGEIDKKDIEKIKERLRGIKFDEFDARLGYTGSFSYHGNPRIVWLKVEGKGIYELQKKIDDSLEGIFEKEERFMGHLTVARIKYAPDKKGFKEYVDNMGVKEVKFKVNNFKLKKSELRRMGPVYETVEEFSSSSGKEDS